MNFIVSYVMLAGPVMDELVIPVAVKLADLALEGRLLHDVLYEIQGQLLVFWMSHGFVVVVVRDQVLAKLTAVHA